MTKDDYGDKRLENQLSVLRVSPLCMSSKLTANSIAQSTNSTSPTIISKDHSKIHFLIKSYVPDLKP